MSMSSPAFKQFRLDSSSEIRVSCKAKLVAMCSRGSVDSSNIKVLGSSYGRMLNKIGLSVTNVGDETCNG